MLPTDRRHQPRGGVCDVSEGHEQQEAAKDTGITILEEIETTKGRTSKKEKIEKYIKADSLEVVENLTDKYYYFI